ncbi:MAG TPA: hypothetical protein VFX18_04910 [Candidatus Nitrosocosmicus sp.]|nr:hypothetical protein [Candidatus Nitrosocosmicus sp.]
MFGSSLGATGATLLPYWSKLREEQALGHTLKFEKKYVGTLLLAVVVGIVGAVLSFDQTSMQIDSHWTIVKIFIVSVTASATGNVTLNRFLSVSGVLTQLKGLQIENIRLRDENSKLASLSSLNKI